ncbi:signal peptidase I [Nanoarchaeota archaeon]
MKKDDIKHHLKKIWWFIWEDDSIWSWIVNVILAFILIKFIVYPILGLALATSHPIVAVVSGSMEHQGSFDEWWATQQDWYSEKNISKEQFQEFSLKNGFNKGDIIFLRGKDPADIQIGDVIVFTANKPDPIIHRVVDKWEDGGYHFQTKGDFNQGFANVNEQDISEERVIGKALFRVPFVGWVKIAFVGLINLFR